MSTTSSSDGGRRYKPLLPAKKQITFSTERRSAKPASSTPTLNKKQSSLTQMQWVGTPKAREMVDNSSSDNDENYEEPPAKRPKHHAGSGCKKGKKTGVEKREAGQSSFTQVPYLARMRAPRSSGLDGDGFQIWQDSDTEDDVGDDEQAGMETKSSALEAMVEDCEVENKLPEIAESSQNAHVEDEQDGPIDREAESPVADLRTPQKARFEEVPSSQTPPSTKLSTQRPATRHRSISRSPLKERSVNAQSPSKKLRSPESQHMSMKMLERARFAHQQARRKAASAENRKDEDLEQYAAEATDDSSLRTCPMPPPPHGRLLRTTTVQDSQVEDTNEFTAPTVDDERPRLTRTGIIADSQRNSSNETIAEDSRRQRPVRRLRRVATVQDSQFDDNELDLRDEEAPADLGDTHETMNDDNDDYEYNATSPEGTYDPAFSALDRDASRFKWTQTQQLFPAVYEDSETEDEDLDRGCAANVTQKTGMVSDSASQEIGAPLPSPQRPTPKRKDDSEPEDAEDCREGPGLAEAPHRGASTYESGDRMPMAKETEVPSSPPPPRPFSMRFDPERSIGDDEEACVPSSPPSLRASQVSTIVPTQASVALRAPSPQRPIKAEPLSLPPTPRHQQKSQPLDIMMSPQKSSSLWQPESLSSSPLALPPWSSPEKHSATEFDLHRRVGGSVGLSSEPRLDSLADFSLPPPPPLSSSRRQTPASSSL